MSENATGSAMNPHARRCKAKSKRTKERCKNPARKGYAVCAHHGAGYRRKPGGRPPRHGLRIDPGQVLEKAREVSTSWPICDAQNALALSKAALDLTLEELERQLAEGRVPLEAYAKIMELCSRVSIDAGRLVKPRNAKH